MCYRIVDSRPRFFRFVAVHMFDKQIDRWKADRTLTTKIDGKIRRKLCIRTEANGKLRAGFIIDESWYLRVSPIMKKICDMQMSVVRNLH